MRRRPPIGNRDANEGAIVAALEAAGCSVARLSGDAGVPDLVVGVRGRTELLEVKNPATDRGRASKRRIGQVRFRRTWRGAPILEVWTELEALEVLGLVR